MPWFGRKQELPKPWKLFNQAIRDYRANWGLLVWVATIVGLPVSIISAYALNPTADSSLSAYLALAQMALHVAIIYTVVRLIRGEKVSARDAYYSGSGLITRELLVGFLLVLMLLPLVLGLVIAGAGVIAPGTELNVGEKLLVSVLALAVGLPSFILMTRSIWSIYVVAETDLGPIEAFRESWARSRGKGSPLLGRLLALLLFLLLVMLIPAIICVGLQYLTGWRFFSLVLQYVATLLVIPLAHLYAYRLHRELK